MAQRRKYQSNEYIKELGLNWMNFNARQYDPQIGRFLGVDPLATSGGQDMFSPYAAMGNAPENIVDPNGTSLESPNGHKEIADLWDPASVQESPIPDAFGGGGAPSGFNDPIWGGGFDRAMQMAADARKKEAAKQQGESNTQGNGSAASNFNSNHRDGDQQREVGSNSGTWTLSFTGEAIDKENNGNVRQMGIGKLAILDADGNIVASYDAISGDGINGLLPNGDYKATKLTMNGGFSDETGLDYKIFINPVGKLTQGFQRTELRIHPTQYNWVGTVNGVRKYTTLATDGCIGLVGNANAAPFLLQMQTYFKGHSFIMLNVNILNNANVKTQLGNKKHY